MSGALYVVATPIGHLADMTYRAVEVLNKVSLIAAEDTRHSRKLLTHYGISTPLISYHEHNEQSRTRELLQRLAEGADLALISDAGTPCIADPGYRLVAACRQAGVAVRTVPGATALIAALAIAGLPTDEFLFVGFLPAKQQRRRTLLERLVREPRTLVCYESPRRLPATLADLAAVCGAERRIAVARELTKRHEEFFNGTVDEASAHFAAGSVKGELVLLLEPPPPAELQGSLREELERRRAASDASWKQIVKEVAREFGIPGSEVYRESLPLRDRDNSVPKQTEN